MTNTKLDIYASVTNRIITQLEAGCVPWVRPWDRSGGAIGLPMNAKTNNSYSGINILQLWGSIQDNGFASNSWLTFKQAKDLGGNVLRGSKGTQAVFASTFVPKDVDNRDTELAPVAFLKKYTVFNLDQIEGLPSRFQEDVPEIPELVKHSESEALIRRTGADVRNGGNKAFFSTQYDFVQVPPLASFGDPLDYYRTAFHELGHWTGHKSRLDRTFGARHGDSVYAREELVAELTAAFVSASLGIAPTLNHANYLNSWLQVLKADKRAIFQAASKASKACEFLLAQDQAVRVAA